MIAMSASVTIAADVNVSVHHQAGCWVYHAVKDILISRMNELSIPIELDYDKPCEHGEENGESHFAVDREQSDERDGGDEHPPDSPWNSTNGPAEPADEIAHDLPSH
jgi:hypothetical protein